MGFKTTLAILEIKQACLDALLSDSPLSDVVTAILAAKAVGGITAGECEQMLAMARRLAK